MGKVILGETHKGEKSAKKSPVKERTKLGGGPLKKKKIVKLYKCYRISEPGYDKCGVCKCGVDHDNLDITDYTECCDKPICNDCCLEVYDKECEIKDCDEQFDVCCAEQCGNCGKKLCLNHRKSVCGCRNYRICTVCHAEGITKCKNGCTQ